VPGQRDVRRRRARDVRDLMPARTCASQHIQCCPAGDGCGNELMWGSCVAPLTCGGGGVSGVCGHQQNR
jgi:hypothetical protein